MSIKLVGIILINMGKNPDVPICRQEMFNMSYRAMEASEVLENCMVPAAPTFENQADIADYADPALAWLSQYQYGLISGTNGNIYPQNNATYGESA